MLIYIWIKWSILVMLASIPIAIFCVGRLQKKKTQNHFFDWMRFTSQKGVWARCRDDIGTVET